MTKQRTLQVYRGTTVQNDAYTGASGEITYDTEEKRVRVHDGATAGGIRLAKSTEGVPVGGDYVVESSTGANSWYRKYASGWVEQGGNKLNNTTAYTLPIEMADTNYNIQCSNNDNDNVFVYVKCVKTSTTEIAIKGYNLGSTNNDWAGTWLVIGQAAA